jgi:hypothetical protein
MPAPYLDRKRQNLDLADINLRARMPAQVTCREHTVIAMTVTSIAASSGQGFVRVLN